MVVLGRGCHGWGGCGAHLARPYESHRAGHGGRRGVHGGSVVAGHLGRTPAGPRVGRRLTTLATGLLTDKGHEVGEVVLAGPRLPGPVLVVLVGGGAGAGAGVVLGRAVVEVLGRQTWAGRL